MAGGYVSVKLDPTQASEIESLFKKVNISCMKADDFHSTLMTDERNIDVEHDSKSNKVYNATISGVDTLGDYVVLLLDSKDLEARHKQLKDAGFEHSYDTILCHMSVIHEPEDTDMDLVELMFKLDAFPKVLKFTSEENEILKD